MAKDNDSRRNLPEVNGFKIERRQKWSGHDDWWDVKNERGQGGREREVVLEKLSIILIFLQVIN